MTDEAVIPPVVEPPAVQPPAPPASQSEPPAEHMIPKSRLDEEIAKRKTAEDKLKEISDAEIERKKSEMTEIERLKLEKEESDTKRTNAEKELADERAKLAAEKSFNAVIAKLNLTFANDKARENVWRQLDITKPDGYEVEVKKIMTDEPYYFKAIEVPDLDATQKGKQKNGIPTDAEKAELKKRFRIK